MLFTFTKDTEFGDCFFVISKSDKRLISTMLKTYERTGTYEFLKCLKRQKKNTSFNREIR